MNFHKRITFFLGLAIAAAVGGGLWVGGLPSKACWTGAVTALCAVWWMTEAIPIPATSLVPFALFPLLGILTEKQVAAAYGDWVILLFLGGFILSLALERSGLHHRLAIGMVKAVGGYGGRRLVLGFMLASAMISMWVSNSATVLMLLPVAIAVLGDSQDPKLGPPLLLGVAYAASIGGVGTPLGSPPTMIFMSQYQQAGLSYSFLDWMKIGVPTAVIFLPIAWWWLTRGLNKAERLELPQTGPWKRAEVGVFVVFCCTVLLWVTREVPFGGWDGLLKGYWGVNEKGSLAGDSTVALLAAVSLFLIPDGRGGKLMNWETAKNLPWDILLLFGGGLAIGAAFKSSGLNEAIGEGLRGLTSLPPWAMIAAICFVSVFVSELTSNTAMATLTMPILLAAALAAKVEPAMLMVPATLSNSLGFMMPVGTPPNAIVFGTGRVPMRTMVRHGFALDIIGAAVVSAMCYLLLR